MKLNRRLPTAIILLGLVFLVIQYAPEIVLFLLQLAFIIGALVEFYNLAEKKGLRPQRTLGLVAALLVTSAFYFPSIPFDMALFAGLLLAAFYFVFSFRRPEQLPDFPASFAITLIGAVYIAFPLSYILRVRTDYGSFYLYFLFAVIFLGDSGAYFIGSPLGKRKMTPLASPNKTWEGSAGGLLFAALGALGARFLLLPEIPLWKALVCGVLVHAAAQVSDPLESLFKRAAGVKDSSNALPGHGGFLDRIDSLILATPLFYYLVKYFWK
jgi:phosphatidate cytidylyltransferase